MGLYPLMRVPLLSHADPIIASQKGPRVRLRPGLWSIENNHTIVDSVMNISLYSHPTDLQFTLAFTIFKGLYFELIETMFAQVSFEKRGTEKFVTIFASLEEVHNLELVK